MAAEPTQSPPKMRSFKAVIVPVYLEKLVAIAVPVLMPYAAASLQSSLIDGYALLMPVIAIHALITGMVAETTLIDTERMRAGGAGEKGAETLFIGAIAVTILFSAGFVAACFLYVQSAASLSRLSDAATREALTLCLGLSAYFVISAIGTCLRNILQFYGLFRGALVAAVCEALVGTLLLICIFISSGHFAAVGLVLAGVFALAALAQLCAALLQLRSKLRGWAFPADRKAWMAALHHVPLVEALSAAVPALSFYLAITLQIVLIGRLDQDALVTRAFMLSIMNAVGPWPWALSNWLRIGVAQDLGAKLPEAAVQKVNRALCAGLIGVAVTGMAFAVVALDLLPSSISTSAPSALVFFLLWVVPLEAGRSSNVMLASALRAAHDVRTPAAISVATTWLIAIGVGTVLAFPLGMGVHGLIGALVGEEAVRAAIMWARWHHFARSAGASVIDFKAQLENERRQSCAT